MNKCNNVLLFVGPDPARQKTDCDVRWDKVQSLQAAIDSGSYFVDAGVVADKIISLMLECAAPYSCDSKSARG